MTEVEARYRRYIEALNERRLDDLDGFVHDELTYNGRAMTRTDYRDLIANGIAAIPDLVFAIDLLVTGSDTVAARLTFDCTPAKPFMGLKPTGRRVFFAEHVFYRLREGRICEVWSLIDTPALAAQLAG